MHTWSLDSRGHHLNPGIFDNDLANFVTELQRTGYTPLTVEGYATSIAHFGTWVARRKLSIEDIGVDTLASFAKHRCRCAGGRRMDHVSARYVRRVRRFIRYLQLQGVLCPTLTADEPVLSSGMAEFGQWLLHHRGLRQPTIQRYKRLVGALLSKFEVPIAACTAAQVRAVVREYCRDRSIAQTKCITIALRAYFKFLASTGACTAGLEHSIPAVAQWRLSSLPRYLPAERVEQVIRACNMQTSLGRRDRAAILLMARLGLRAGDIVNLRVDDVDWCNATLRVQGKGRKEVRLPLPQDVGDALLACLADRAHLCLNDHVFVCAQAPHRPFRHSATVSSIVAAALRRAGIADSPTRGANLLRHSAATTMLRAGATLEAVGTVLRHRWPDTTMHYAKVHIGMLQSVVQPWPGGAVC
jgi:site-specific recombinase XerD